MVPGSPASVLVTYVTAHLPYVKKKKKKREGLFGNGGLCQRRSNKGLTQLRPREGVSLCPHIPAGGPADGAILYLHTKHTHAVPPSKGCRRTKKKKKNWCLGSAPQDGALVAFSHVFLLQDVRCMGTGSTSLSSATAAFTRHRAIETTGAFAPSCVKHGAPAGGCFGKQS